jgi:hypothetical protein
MIRPPVNRSTIGYFKGVVGGSFPSSAIAILPGEETSPSGSSEI